MVGLKYNNWNITKEQTRKKKKKGDERMIHRYDEATDTLLFQPQRANTLYLCRGDIVYTEEINIPRQRREQVLQRLNNASKYIDKEMLRRLDTDNTLDVRVKAVDDPLQIGTPTHIVVEVYKPESLIYTSEE